MLYTCNRTTITMSKEWVVSGRSYDIDQWYDRTSHLTPRSFFVPMTREHMEAIVDLYRDEFCSRPLSETGKTRDQLRSLRIAIDEVMMNNKHILSWFVRLSCRSPKDGTPANLGAKMSDLPVFEGVEINNLEASDELFANMVLINLFRLSNVSLKVHSGYDALHLLCTSERIFRDLVAQIDHDLTTQLVLRAFDDDIVEMWEFRCFVHGRRLAAISQYNPYVVHSELQGQENFIRDVIQRFFDEHRDAIPFDQCVMDVCVVPAAVGRDPPSSTEPAISPLASADARVVLIEFNPYDRHTGPALFDWSRDDALLRGGGQPCAVRLRALPVLGAPVLAEVMARDRAEQERRVFRNSALLRVDLPSCVMPPAAGSGAGAAGTPRFGVGCILS
jgi:hypothetical protein